MPNLTFYLFAFSLVLAFFFFFLAFNWPCTILPFLKFIGDVLSLHWEMQKVLVEWEFFFYGYSHKLSYQGHPKQAVERVRRRQKQYLHAAHLKLQVWNHLGFLLEQQIFLCRKFLSTAEERLGYISYIIVNKLSTIDVLILRCNQISYLIWTREDGTQEIS